MPTLFEILDEFKRRTQAGKAEPSEFRSGLEQYFEQRPWAREEPPAWALPQRPSAAAPTAQAGQVGPPSAPATPAAQLQRAVEAARFTQPGETILGLPATPGWKPPQFEGTSLSALPAGSTPIPEPYRNISGNRARAILDMAIQGAARALMLPEIAAAYTRLTRGQQAPGATPEDYLSTPTTTGQRLAEFGGYVGGLLGPVVGAATTGGRIAMEGGRRAAGAIARRLPERLAQSRAVQTALRLTPQVAQGLGTGATLGAAGALATEAAAPERKGLPQHLADIASEAGYYGAYAAAYPLAAPIVEAVEKKVLSRVPKAVIDTLRREKILTPTMQHIYRAAAEGGLAGLMVGTGQGLVELLRTGDIKQAYQATFGEAGSEIQEEIAEAIAQRGAELILSLAKSQPARYRLTRGTIRPRTQQEARTGEITPPVPAQPPTASPAPAAPAVEQTAAPRPVPVAEEAEAAAPAPQQVEQPVPAPTIPGPVPSEQEPAAPAPQPAAATAEEQARPQQRFRPAVGQPATVTFTADWGRHKTGTQFTGRVERIYRKNKAVLVELQTEVGKITVPVSKYVDWSPPPSDRTTQAPVPEIPETATAPTGTEAPPRPAQAEVQQMAPVAAEKAPTPDRVRWIGRGKRGRVRVVFPDQGHAMLFSFWSRVKRGIQGELPGDQSLNEPVIRRALGIPEEANFGELADAYAEAVKEAIKDLPENATYEAPRLEEALQARQPAPQTPKREPAPPVAAGNTTRAWTDRGTEIEAQYAVYEARDLVASHDTNLRPSPEYPQELQPRERTRAASEQQITEIAKKLTPERLGESASAAEGAPIVGPDAVVESGNGRVIALKRLYEQGHANAERYRRWLLENAQRFGIDRSAVEQAQAPVLVRVRRTEVDRRRFAEEANAPSVAAMSATEQAMADARKLTGEMLRWFAPSETGEINAPQNREFIRDFLQNVVAPSERGRYLTPEGFINQDGLNRIRNAIFARAYGDPAAIQKLAESTDNNVRNITTGMLIAAPRLVQVKEGIEQGRLFNLDITQEVAAAMKKLSELRESGADVQQYLKGQRGEVGGQITLWRDLSDTALDVLDVFVKHARSAKKISQILMAYADIVDASGDPRQATLFQRAVPTMSEALEAAVKRVESSGEGQLAFEVLQNPPVGGEGAGAPAGERVGRAEAPARPAEARGAVQGAAPATRESPALQPEAAAVTTPEPSTEARAVPQGERLTEADETRILWALRHPRPAAKDWLAAQTKGLRDAGYEYIYWSPSRPLDFITSEEGQVRGNFLLRKEPLPLKRMARLELVPADARTASAVVRAYYRHLYPGDDSYVLMQPNGERGAIIHPSRTKQGGWRVTRFDEQGFSGHDEYPSEQAALEDAVLYRYVIPGPDVLEEWAQRPEFVRVQQEIEAKKQAERQAVETGKDGIRVGEESGRVWIQFPTTPGSGLRSRLKDAGFRWDADARRWYAVATGANVKVARQIAGLPEVKRGAEEQAPGGRGEGPAGAAAAPAGPSAGVRGHPGGAGGRAEAEAEGVQVPVPEDERQVKAETGQVINPRASIQPKVTVDAVAEHPDLAGKLFEHQREGVNLALSALEKQGAFLIADGTGAGKTAQALTLAEILRRRGAQRILILTERDAIVRDAWLGDAQRIFGGKIKIEKWSPSKTGPGIFVTTYSQLRVKNPVPVTGWDAVIFDESHNLKNAIPDQDPSQQAVLGMKLADNARYVVYMSATPVDKLQDYYYLGKKLGLFGNFSEFISWLDRLGIEHVQRKIRRGGREQTIWIYRRKPWVRIADLVAGLNKVGDELTRRGLMVKREVPLTGLTVHIYRVPLSREDMDHLDRIYAFFGGDQAGPTQRALQVLYQRRHLESKKIKSAINIAARELAQGRQVGIFVAYKEASSIEEKVFDPAVQGHVLSSIVAEADSVIRELREGLQRLVGADKVAEIHGGLAGEKPPNIQEEIEAFQSGRKKVVIATLSAGDTGISLHDATGTAPRTQIVVTLPWGAKGMVQVAGRMHRLTSKSDTKLIALLSEDQYGNPTWIDGRLGEILAAKMKQLHAFVKGEIDKLDLDRGALYADLGESMTTEALAEDLGGRQEEETLYLRAPKAARAEPEAKPTVPAVSPKTARQIADLVARSLRTVIRAGRTPPGTLGQFSPKAGAGTVRRKVFDAWRAVGHELGHALERAGFQGDAGELAKLGQAMYPAKISGKAAVREGLADFLVLWVANPDQAKRQAPNTFAAFEQWIELGGDTLKQAFAQVRLLADQEIQGSPLAKALGTTRFDRLREAMGALPGVRGEEYSIEAERRGRPLGRIRGWLARRTYSAVDYTIPAQDFFAAAEQAAKGKGGIIDPSKLMAISGGAYEKSRIAFLGRPRDELGRLVAKGRRPLVQIAQDALNLIGEKLNWQPEKVPVGKDIQEVGAFQVFDLILKARRSVERSEKGFEELPMDTDVAKELLAWAEQKFGQKAVELAAEYSQTLSDITLNRLERAGIISGETRKQVEEGSDPESYIPIYYDDRQEPIVRLRADGRRTPGQPVRRFRGRVAPTIDFHTATLLKLAEVEMAVEYHRVLREIEKGLSLPGMGRFGSFEAAPIKGVTLGPEDLARVVRAFFGPEAAERVGERVITLFRPGGLEQVSRQEPVVMIRHGDKPVYMRLAPDLYNALMAMKPIMVSPVVRMMARIARVQRFTGLVNLRTITNIISRDLVQSAIQTEAPIKEWARHLIDGAAAAVGLDPELTELYMSSGGFGGAAEHVIRSMARATISDELLHTSAPGWRRTAKGTWVRVVNSPHELLRVLEEYPRYAEWLAVFKKEVKRLGEDPERVLELLRKGEADQVPEKVRAELERILVDAAYASRNVTVNFSLHGASDWMRAYVNTVPFLQGSIQGIYRFMREARRNPPQAFIRTFLLTVPMSVISWLLMHANDDDRKWYEDLPSEARDRYWWSPIPGTPFYLATSKPYEYSLMANVVERFLDWTWGSQPHRRKPLQDLGKAIKVAFSLDPVNPLLLTAIQLYANRTELGAPIEPMGEQDLAKELRYGPGTSQTAILFSRTLATLFADPKKGLSPRQIDFLVTRVFGGPGRSITRGADAILRRMGFGPGVEPPAGAEYAPIVGGILYGRAEGASRIVDRFYADIERGTTLEASARRWAAQQIRPAVQFSPDDVVLVSYLGAMRAIRDLMADARKEIKDAIGKGVDAKTRRRLLQVQDTFERLAAGYVYGVAPPTPPADSGITPEMIQRWIELIDRTAREGLARERQRAGGPTAAAEWLKQWAEPEQKESRQAAKTGGG